MHKSATTIVIYCLNLSIYSHPHLIETVYTQFLLCLTSQVCTYKLLTACPTSYSPGAKC